MKNLKVTTVRGLVKQKQIIFTGNNLFFTGVTQLNEKRSRRSLLVGKDVESYMKDILHGVPRL